MEAAKKKCCNGLQSRAIDSITNMMEESGPTASRSSTPNMLFIHGPPGTGKSQTVARLVEHLILCTEEINKGPILLAAPSNKAVEVIMSMIIKV